MAKTCRLIETAPGVWRCQNAGCGRAVTAESVPPAMRPFLVALPLVMRCGPRPKPERPPTPAAPARDETPAETTARLLAEIDAAIDAGRAAPWSQFDRDRAGVVRILAEHCQPCPELSPAGCNRVPWPCKRWSLWRQTVLVGWCERWGKRAGGAKQQLP